MVKGFLKFRLILLLCLVLVIDLFAGEREPEPPFWQVVSYCNSTTAYGIVTIDGVSAESGDIVASFSAGECRGFQEVSFSQETAYVTLVINGEQSELVEFKLYDFSSQSILDINFTVWTMPGGSIGYPPDFLPLNAQSETGNTIPYAEFPDFIEITEPQELVWHWQDDFYDPDNDLLFFDYDIPDFMEIECDLPSWQPISSSAVTQVFSYVYLTEADVAAGDLLAAFVQNECRGTAEIQFWNNEAFAALSVYGTEIEEVFFKLYSSSNEMTYISENSIISNPGGMVGFPDVLELYFSDTVIESDLHMEISEVPQQSEIVEFYFADHPPFSAVRPQIVFTSQFINHPPQIELPPVSFPEDTDFSLNLNDYAYDPDGDNISYNLNNQSLLNASITDSILHLNAPEDWFGDTSIIVIASDNSRFYALDTLAVNVIPVNDAPQINLPPSLTFPEDSSAYLNLNNYVFDVDDDSLLINFTASDIFAVVPSAPLWNPVEYDSWCNAYLTLNIEDGVISDASQVAAFSGDECRGLAPAIIYNNQVYVIMQIYCFQQHTPIFFKLYDSQTNTAWTTSDPVFINPNSNLGFPPDYYPVYFDHIINIEVYEFIPEPDWFGSEIVTVTVTDSWQASATDEMELIVTNQPDPPRINSNLTLEFAAGVNDWISLFDFVFEPDGDAVQFFIDAPPFLNELVMQHILVVDPNLGSEGDYFLTLTAEDETGLSSSAQLPLIIHPQYSGNLTLVSGWNWIGCGWGSNHYETDIILSSIDNAGSYLLGQNDLACFVDNLGWLGTLTEIDPFSSYKMQLNSDAQLLWNGWSISDSTINLQEGWNWVSFLPSEPMEISMALSSLDGAGELIKTIHSYSAFYEDLGWLGTLNVLEPGNGYILKTNTSCQLTFSEPTRSDKTLQIHSSLDDYANYKYTSCFTAVIPGYIPQTHDRLIAFADDRICGEASLTKGSISDLRNELGEFYYFLYLYSHSEETKPLSLKIHRFNDNKFIPIEGEFFLRPETVTGSIENPVVLEMADEENCGTASLYETKIYPNPFYSSNTGNLKIDTPAEKVQIFNLKGQLVKEIDSEGGVIEWNMRNRQNNCISTGVYLIKSVSEKGMVKTRKFLYLK